MLMIKWSSVLKLERIIARCWYLRKFQGLGIPADFEELFTRGISWKPVVIGNNVLLHCEGPSVVSRLSKHCVQWVLGVSAGRPRVTTSTAAAAARRGDVVYYRTPRTTSTLQQLFITPNYHDHQARIVDGRRRRRWAPPRAYFRPPLLAAPSSSSDSTSLLQQLPLVVVSV